MYQRCTNGRVGKKERGYDGLQVPMTRPRRVEGARRCRRRSSSGA